MTKLIPILSDRCLVVEMDKFTDFDCPMEIHGNKLVSSQSNGLVINTTKLPPGNWRIIGMLSEVKEEQAATLVRWDGPYKFFTVDTKVESLESAIECEGYSFKHPEFPDINDPKFYDEPYDGTGFYQEIYSGAIEEYHKAQSRILDRSRCLLLGREV